MDRAARPPSSLYAYDAIDILAQLDVSLRIL